MKGEMIMRHVFKKYTSNRGSALFMVISTMTALLISVMAMYFAMVSSRQTQYAVFNKMQASQSSQSIAEIVANGLRNANTAVDPDPAGQALLEEIKKMDTIGETISTSAANFQSLDPNNPAATNKDVDQLGAYAVTITLKEILADGTKMYDISVMSSVQGNRDVIHMEFGFNSETKTEGGGTNPPGDSELFAATGYVPNDAYLDGGFFLTNTFFDTEFTYVGQYDSKANFLSGNLSTGGSLLFQSYIQPIANESRFSSLSKPTTWAIRGDFEENGSNQVTLVGGSKIMIGGDAIFNNATVTSSGGGYVDIYILGDFILNANMSFSNANVYVLGDFSMKSGLWTDFHNLYVNGEVHFPDNGKPSIQGSHVNSPDSMPKWDGTAPGMTVTQVEEELGRRTSTKTYGKWVIPDNTVNDVDGKTIKIRLNSSNTETNGVEGMKNVFTLAYDNGKNKTDPNYRGSEAAKDEGVNGWKADYKGTGFTIDGFEGKAGAGSPLAIILDTGDDPDNVMALRLKPYIDMDGDGTAETFAWLGKNGIKSSDPFTIIVKGRGSVIMEVAEGATYQECDRQQVMNYSWFKLLGGKEYPKTGSRQNASGQWSDFNVYIYDSGSISGGDAVDGKKPDIVAAEYIHDDCIKGDGCSYTTTTSTQKCGACGKELTEVTCSVHGKVDTFCPECQKYKVNKLANWNAAADGTRAEGFCSNRIDKAKVKTYLDAHIDIKNALTYPKRNDSDESFVYPNANIYLVTCSESTDLRFSDTINGDSVIQNGFYGYIYAPYITYMAKSNSGSGCPRFLGGLVVSDYVINDNYAFLACYPDKMPEEITNLPGGGNMSGNLAGKTTKSWKTIIGGYH